MPRLLASLERTTACKFTTRVREGPSSGWRPRSNRDRRLILQALRARNIDQACNLLARHIQTRATFKPLSALSLPRPDRNAIWRVALPTRRPSRERQTSDRLAARCGLRPRPIAAGPLPS
ncbi:FCD domain-containing protein [Bradyrhizobium sp. CNPSo 4026]|nr:FCD domain-containing protein [Bradyrhizobium cenepequi]